MCIAVPGKIIKLNEDKTHATVDFGGITRKVNSQLIADDVTLGDYVLIHTGYAIQKIDEEAALETLALWKEIGDQLPV